MATITSHTTETPTPTITAITTANATKAVGTSLDAETLFQQGQKAYENKDYASAIKLYEQAVAQRHEMATATLAKLYYQIDLVSQEKDLYKRAIATQNPTILMNLGVKYQKGDGVNRNCDKAIQLFSMAIAYGSIEALLYLGQMYHKGEGVNQNEAEALRYFEEAASHDNSAGLYSLGLIYLTGSDDVRRVTTAQQYFELAAAKGYALAHEKLGHIYCHGYIDETDYIKGRHCYEKAIELSTGSVESSLQVRESFYELSRMYRYASGVPRDIHMAMSILIRGYQACRWHGFIAELRDIFEYEQSNAMEYLIDQMSTLDQLRADLAQMKSRLTELETQIEFQPSGVGFERARDEFYALAKTSSQQ
jgi:TPR repeat protein